MIDLSGSELHAVAAKALVGAGACSAVASDGATAALWLHAKGHNGTAAIVTAAESTASAQSVGISAIDLLISQPSAATTIDFAVSPLLLIGLLGVASARHGATFALTSTDTTVTTAPVEITPTTLTGPIDALAPPLAITSTIVAANRRNDLPRALRVPVSESDWQRVNAAAARIYVPSNERSRATGAGAGLTDND